MNFRIFCETRGDVVCRANPMTPSTPALQNLHDSEEVSEHVANRMKVRLALSRKEVDRCDASEDAFA